MKTADRRSHFQRSLAGVVLAGAMVALWGAAMPGSLPSGTSEPMIDSVTPTSGPEGTVVTIGGANFGPSVGAVQGTSGVSFNGVGSTPTSWSDSSITVTVPPGATTGGVAVTVGGRPSAGVEFTVTGAGGSGPAIGTVSPMLGVEGTVVTIRGGNFGPAAEMGGVSFNGVWASARSWNEEEIRVAVPADAGTGPVVVTANGGASNGAGFIVVEPGQGEPAIHSLSSGTGPEGMVVTIEGENFGPSIRALKGTSGVSFNGVWGVPASWSDTVIQVPVPAGTPSGLVTVAVGGEASNGLAFVVERPAPVIEAVDSSFGPEGTMFEIKGRHFGPAMEAVQGWSGVSIEGVWGVPAYWSDREIQVAAPAGVSSGLIVVSSGGYESNGIPFAVRSGKTMSPAPVVAASSVAPRAGPTLKSLDPTAGPVGTAVKIKGKNLGASRGTNTVTFNGTEVTNYVSWANKRIDVEVPAGATTGDVVVTIGGAATAGIEFTVTAGADPSITTLNPDSGPEGTSVTITGVNFGATQGTGTVAFNGTAATPTSWSDTSITVAVPMGATTGDVVVTAGGTASAGVAFTVTPAISGLSPDKGPAGTSVEITGTNFGAAQGTSTVTFNGTSAAASSWADTSITVTVPAGATTGDVVVTVDGEASAGVAFTVTLGISSLSSDSGPEGTSVTISGTGFGATQGTSTVEFNGTEATATNWSETSITVTVPAGATTGDVVVTVGEVASNGVAFTVTPGISSLSPIAGAEGATVTITGTNFKAAQGTSTVTFNGVTATPASWSDSSITVTVPAGATTGPVVVTVGGQASNGVSFTVGTDPVIGSVSPASGPVGTTVKVTGANFGATRGTSAVAFNGTSATPASWSDSSITVDVPAGATSGSVVVTVDSVASNGASFAVTPAITGLSRVAGPEGTPVTISGTSFGATRGTSAVTFNGTAVTTYTSWSDTSITVAVPAGATSGSVVATVGGVASNGAAFTVGTDPTVSSLSPALGQVGTSVVIGGANFGATQGTSAVTFNGTAATPSSWSDTSITVTVPSTATTGPVVVTVGTAASNQVTFTVTGPPPVIGKLKPEDGGVGESVKVKGEHFGTVQGMSTITFNGLKAAARQWEDEKITVNVPAGARTGPVVVTVDGQASNGVTFTVTGSSPSIISLDPSSGEEETSVTITGVNFGATQGTSTVTFNGVSATPASWGDTSITVPVPAGASTGPVAVTVNGQVSNGETFTVTVPAPAITGLNPTSGHEGTSVTISGENFGATRGTSTVSFNGTAATPASWSATSITAAVPAGAATGNVVVTVGGQGSNGVAFTVTPAIGSLTPTKGPEGTSVEITGTSFGAAQGTSTVTFNGTAATPTGWSATSITAAVPAGATTGDVVVTVDSQASNGVVFTVTPAIGSLSPNKGPEGTSVEITGTSFGATQGTSTVTFNGTAATAASWSATSITAAVPAGATTGNVVVTVDSQASNGVAFTVTPAISALSPNKGPVGASVEVTGTSFGATQGTSTVTFNGTAATAASWSATSITAAVPAGATTGNVVVTVDSQASNGVTFTVTPGISSVSPDKGPEGTSVAIAGTSFGAAQGTSTVTFNGTAATASSWSATSITVAVPSGATTGNVVVTVGGEASNGVTFTVRENRAPEVEQTIAAQTVNKGASLELTVSSYFSDPDEDDLQYTAVSSDTAKVTVAVNGAVVTLTGVAKGDATVTVTAGDGDLTAEQAFTVTVPNSPPVKEGSVSAQTVNKGDSADLTVSSYFSDADEDALEYSAVSSNTAKVTVAVNGAVVTLTGVAKGDATVTVTASDGDLTAQQAFTVTVPNSAPAKVGSVSAQTVNKGASADLTVSSYFSDADEDALEYSAVSSDTAKVTVAVNGAVVTLSGVAKGDATVTVTAGDGDLTAEQAFTVTVPNSAPVKVGSVSAQTVNKGASADLTVSSYFSDADEDNLEYTAVSSDTAKVTVAVNGAVVTLTGVAKGDATVTVTAGDGSLTAEQGFTVTVPNRAPAKVGSVSAQTVNKGASADLTVSSYFSDADEDNLEYTAVSSDTAKVTVAVNGAVVTLTGVARGDATVTVTASDGGLTAEQAFTVTVPNGAPVCGDIPAQTLWVNDDLAVDLSTYCSDPDGDSLTYTATSSATSKVTESVSGSTLTLTGKALGSSDITITATDNPGNSRDSLSTTETFTATVKNRAPDCTFSAQTLDLGQSKDLGVTGRCTDADGHGMTYSAASSSDSSIVSVERRSNNTVVRITGKAAGTATVTVTVADGQGGSTTEPFSVTVKPSCDLSSIGNQTIFKGDSRTLSLSSACDGTYSASSSDSTKATVSVNNSTDKLTITGVAVGTATVTVRVRKTGYTDDSVRFTVRVREKPSCDLSSIGNQTIIEGDSRTLSLSSACDGTYSASSSDTSKVTVSVNDSTDKLTITGVTVGTATVTARVAKSGYRSDSEPFTVTVTPPPPDPEADLSANSTTLDADGCVDLSWTTANTKSADINGEAIPTDDLASGKKQVCPGAEQKYTLTANGHPKADNPTATDSVTVKPSCDLSSIGNQTLIVTKSKTISLSSTCSGTYSASSSDTGKVTVSVNNSTDKLKITGVAAGTATVTVTVTKSGYADDSGTFTVTVKPSCDLSSISGQTVDVGQSKTLSLSSVCEGTYSASSSATGKVTVSVNNSTDKLKITGVAAGTATVTVTVTKSGYTDDSGTFTVTVNRPKPSTPSITSISPSLQRPDDPVTIYGNHFGSTAGSVSFGGHSISSFSGQGYSWSNTSISLLIPGSLGAGQVSVSVTTSGGSTSNSYSYTVTGSPVRRGACEEGDEDCPKRKEAEESGDSDDGETDEDAAEGGA